MLTPCIQLSFISWVLLIVLILSGIRVGTLMFYVRVKNTLVFFRKGGHRDVLVSASLPNQILLGTV